MIRDDFGLTLRTDYLIDQAAENENKRVKILNDLHIIKGKTPWVIGKILTEWELALEKNYFAVKKAAETQELGVMEDDLPPKSLHEWYQKHPDELKFGYRSATDYLKIYQSTEKEPPKEVQDLGVRKIRAINKIKNPAIKEKVQEKAIEEGWTAPRVEEEVKKEVEKVEKKVKFDEVKDDIKLNITLDGNKIIITCRNQTHRNIVNSIVNSHVEMYKRKIIDQTE
ncbi:MAG: hypothetical protein GY861_04320 [bacterium]|nr:hypothetical protein [bacterium]